MKFKKGMLKSVIALIMALALSVSVFAATHYVSTSEELEEAFATDTDAEVRVIMQGNITLANQLEAKKGQTYIIDGEAYVLSDVSLIGEGVVEINSDVAGTDGDALKTWDSVDVTVNGDIEAPDGDGVDAKDNSKVTVNGNIKADYDGVDANDNSTVTVNGNVTAHDDGILAEDNSTVKVNGNVSGDNYGINGNDDSNVEVTGNVDGKYAGIDAEDNAKVSVKGDVSGRDGELENGYSSADGGDGVRAADNAQVSVDGNVKGGNGTATDEELASSDGYADGGNGVSAAGNGQIEVTGDVTGGNAAGTYGYGGNGVMASEKSDVSVGGNVKGGDVIGNPDTKSNGTDRANEPCGAGAGVYKDYESNVTVGGDVTGGDVNTDGGYGGHGVVIVILTPIGQKEGPVAYDNNEDQDDEEYVPIAGNLTVLGTIKGGAAKNSTATPGDGIHYCISNVRSRDNITGDIKLTEDVFDNGYFDGLVNYFNNIYAVIDRVLGDSDEANELVAEMNEAFYGILEDVIDYLGLDADCTFDELQKALNNATDEQLAYIKELTFTRLDGFSDSILAGISEKLSVPTATVWKISDENGGKLVSNELGDDVAAMLLAENTEYIIRTEKSENGTVSVDKETAMEGETVTITVTPDDGYKVKAVYLSGSELKAENGVYSFVVGAGGGYTVSAEFEKIADDAVDGKDEKSSSGIKTGDEAFTALYVVLAVIALGGGVTAVLKKKGSAK